MLVVCPANIVQTLPPMLDLLRHVVHSMSPSIALIWVACTTSAKWQMFQDRASWLKAPKMFFQTNGLLLF